MVIIGLTGSIGMGKSTAAGMLSRMGVPRHDADAAVHRLTGRGGAAMPAIERSWPEVVREGVLDRRALGARAFREPAVLTQLEAILHPLVRADISAFLKRQCRQRAPVVVLDVPLLLEAGLWAWCDLVAVVSAPRFIQRQRVLRRPGMTEEQFERILGRQLSDGAKRRLADFVIPTGLGRGVTFRRLQALVETAKARPPDKWPPHPYRRRIDARNRPRYRNHRA
jgi:dephospho-CoA kinase